MTLNDRRFARRDSLDRRVEVAAEIAASADSQCLIWCDLNSESDALKKAIPGAVEVRGTDSPEYKTKAMTDFSAGNVRILISKPSICGWGMNWQNCSRMIFVGLSDSFEAYYQAVRRCWRFGQKKPVAVDIIISEAEGAVKANIERKQRDAEHLKRELILETRDSLTADIHKTARESEGYSPSNFLILPDWIGESA
jgi:SNF2 family DNA or RNA helicase